jgi:NADH-quinone oxidoreductase subunit N
MLSLIGIPLTGGFFAKYYVFRAALQANLVWLTIIGVVNSAIAAYYYLRLIVVMYMREPSIEAPPEHVSPAMSAALVIAAIATIYLGVVPGKVVDSATLGAKALSPSTTQSTSAATAANSGH